MWQSSSPQDYKQFSDHQAVFQRVDGRRLGQNNRTKESNNVYRSATDETADDGLNKKVKPLFLLDKTICWSIKKYTII